MEMKFSSPFILGPSNEKSLTMSPPAPLTRRRRKLTEMTQKVLMDPTHVNKMISNDINYEIN
jgi:hypothetical protein